MTRNFRGAAPAHPYACVAWKRLGRALIITTLIVTALTVPYLQGSDRAAQALPAYTAIIGALAALFLLFRPWGILRSVSLAGGLPGIAVLVADAAVSLADLELPRALKMAAFALLAASAAAMLVHAGLATTTEVKAKVATARER